VVDAAGFDRPPAVTIVAAPSSEEGDEVLGSSLDSGPKDDSPDANADGAAEPAPEDSSEDSSGDSDASASSSEASGGSPAADGALAADDHLDPDAGSPEGGSGDPPETRDPHIERGEIALAALLRPTLSSATESEFLQNCEVPRTQGLDAWVFELGKGDDGRAKVSSEAAAGSASVAGRAYNAACESLGTVEGSNWSIPGDTKFLVVVAPQGVNTRIALRIGG
jgi:hypothetical protein